MSRILSFTLIAAVLFCLVTPAEAQYNRTWYYLTTGNGHGFQIFDRQQNRITHFLEHPYRYVAPGDDQRTWGIGRRDLAHDIYFGLRIGGSSRWLHDGYASVEYEQQTHIIHATTTFGDAHIDVYYFAPFGYAGNGMLMLIRARNDGANALNLSLYSKPNLKLGQGRVDPSDANEHIVWNDAAAVAHGVETGPGGGHAVYVPIGGLTQAACGSDGDLYNAVTQNGNIGTDADCTGSAQVLVMQYDASVPAGESVWWGQAVLFVNDDPADPRAHLFKDDRTVDDILALWEAFAGDKTAETMHTEALAEFENWRAGLAPSQLDAGEAALWRQSEAILRMGQVRERPQENEGMVLASLPIGEWHTGWVRDAVYAIAAYAMTGHTEEARLGVEFYIGAESGFFSNWTDFIGRNYRVTTCRYFGNGMEESDFNQDGPNLETDGWGLVLWAAKMYLHYSCDLNWLDETTWKGDTVFEALHTIAQDIEDYSNGNLPGPDASIWEVHWDYRQVFAYTSAAQIRGLFDFADIAAAYGRDDLADHYRTFAQLMLSTSKTALTHSFDQSFASHLGVAGDDIYVDGSTVGFLDWRLVDESDSLYSGTLNKFSKLLTGFGGYRRLEPQLSLTGGGSASEYDLSEWILLDLRIGDCWRRKGNASLADTLLNKVTGSAGANDNLIPELFDPDDGRYTGVVPMVGYGAGAWMMSQLEKYGAPAPGINTGFAHCSACVTNPCTGEHEVCKEDGAGGYTCECEPGYHYDAGICVEDTECDPQTTCAGHGQCTGEGLQCECDEGYTGDHCTECAEGYHLEGSDCVEDTPCNPNPCTESNKNVCIEEGDTYRCECNEGYRDESGTCVPISGDGGYVFDDEPACVCGRGGEATRAGWSIFLCFITGLALLRRAKCILMILLVAGLGLPASAQQPAEEPETPPVSLNRPHFPEDGTGHVEGWAFSFHGYARMPLRMHGSPGSPRPPYLVDDNYYLSGFAYTRINETEWAELFLAAETGRTRLVLGLFSSQFSDWSETTLQGQGGISTAFVEHYWDITQAVQLGVRAGMFWDRYGFVPKYDTYIFGRMHMAGLRLRLRLFDLVYAKFGYGAHADVINANQGFTPVAYLQTGVDLGWLDISLFLGTTWTSDSEREFSIVEDGSLRVIGVEARVAIPLTGPLTLTMAHLHAENVVFLANAFEILHSTGGRGLTQNFFGPDSDNGTGKIFTTSLDFTWQPWRLLTVLDGLEVRLFGMLARVASNQWSANPLENFHDRTYFKWGIEPFYRLPFDGWSFLFFSLRYDRVILDADHDSMSFRVFTPRIGITPIQDLNLDIFLSYSAYSYGKNVRLRPNQIPGDLSVTHPDDHVLKLQAQASW